MDDPALQRVSDGRVFTGRQALELKLVDALGDERGAREWLAKEKGIKMTTPVRDWQLRARLRDMSFLHLATAWALEAVGLASLAQRVGLLASLETIDSLNLDGLLALWHPRNSD